MKQRKAMKIVVFVAGLAALLAFSSSEPVVLYRSDSVTMTDTKVVQGRFEAVAESPTSLRSNFQSAYPGTMGKDQQTEQIKGVWKLQKDISSFPQYSSTQVLVDALYANALEEMLMDVRSDGAFMAGAKWDGVWTRDISYSILLSLAIVNPHVAMKSLKAKVKDDHIIQDTGTGGSWPVSTDRMTWALAAWEVFAVTGDNEWLRYAYGVIKNSTADDLETIRSNSTGMFLGESSFLDWREQTYPTWMDPKDIFASQTLGTNAVHFQTYTILAQMADIFGDPKGAYASAAASIRDGMNKYLWMEEKGYYGQYLYGRNFLSLSPKSEALGEALSVLFDIAPPDRARRVIRSTPVLEFGTPCIYPQITDIPPYHNDAIWPFVEAYWTWASAKAKNMRSVEHGLASLYRAAALFVTNKENMVASTGDYLGTQINSDRQLWSVAGNLAMIYRVFYGMSFAPGGMSFDPFVPEPYKGSRTLSNFKYRNAVLTITMNGWGDTIASVTMDGKIVQKPYVPANTKGQHLIVISLDRSRLGPGSVNLVENRFAPRTPVLRREEASLLWNTIEGAVTYRVVRNGKKVAETPIEEYSLPSEKEYAEYQVMAIDRDGHESFLSEPASIVEGGGVIIFDAAMMDGKLEAKHQGYTGKGYVRLETDSLQKIRFTSTVAKAGVYSLDFRYANGNGPINTDNKCAIRTVDINGTRIGVFVFPQRDVDAWNNWGYSNAVRVRLREGSNTCSIYFTKHNTNMNGKENSALLDCARLTLMPVE